MVADPGETTNLIDAPQHAEAVAALRALAREKWALASLTDRSSEEIDPAVLERLAALGYVSNDFDHAAEASDIDAKDEVAVIMAVEKIRAELMARRDVAAAERAYKALLAEYPDLGEARLGLARALTAQGKTDEAVQAYRDALQLQPQSTVLRVNLANALAAAGEHSAGLEEMRAVLAQVPGDNLARLGTLKMLTDMDQLAEGAALAEGWLAEDPDDRGVQAHLGIIRYRDDDPARAEALLRASLADGVPRQLVHRSLAMMALQRGDLPDAALHYEAELRYFPTDPKMFRELAGVHMQLQDWAAAESAYMDLLSVQPRDLRARLGHAQAVFNQAEFERAEEILAPALAAAPDDPDVLLLQANILAKIGDRKEAEAMAARANALNQARVEAARSGGGATPR